jgi:hypothetical protein
MESGRGRYKAQCDGESARARQPDFAGRAFRQAATIELKPRAHCRRNPISRTSGEEWRRNAARGCWLFFLTSFQNNNLISI